MWLRTVRMFAFACVCATAIVTAAFSAHAQADRNGSEPISRSTSIQLAQYYYYPNYPYPQVRRKTYRKRRRTVTPRCAFPWKYSHGLRRCICVAEGYSLNDGKCVKTAEACPRNYRWSQAQNKCVCDDANTPNGAECVNPDEGVVTYRPSGDGQCLWPRVKADGGNGCVCTHGYEERAGQCVQINQTATDVRRRAGIGDLLTSNVAAIQSCLKEAGYLRSQATNKMNRSAWTAFWFFKQDYSVGRTPKGVHDPKAQNKLFALCPGEARKLALLPATTSPDLPTTQPATPNNIGLPAPPSETSIEMAKPETPDKPAESASRVRKVYAKPEADCLPADLHKLIVSTYGPRPNLKHCARTCIAKPASLSENALNEFSSKRGVRWCNSCIEISTPLPLEDILRIERAANVQMCVRPPAKLPKWVNPTTKKRPAYTRVRNLYRALPRNTRNRTNIAVIIGNSAYSSGLSENSSANASADAFYALLTEHLGYEQENILDHRSATLETMNKLFGDEKSHEGALSRRLAGSPDAKVLVYYAGHAFTRADGGESYLLPADTMKYREGRTGYQVSRLYANLQAAGAKSVTVLLEADFGRDLSDHVFAPNLPEMQVSALPPKPIPGINILTAADGDQRTLDDPKFGIGLFTRYLIEGLAGRADLAPIGNGDGRIDTVELYAYTSHMVRLNARKSFGLLQKPMMSRSGNIQVSQVQ